MRILLLLLGCAEPTLPEAPPLTRESVRSFVGWASAATPAHAAALRSRLLAARHDRGAVDALAGELRSSVGVDHGQALMTLALLGELRSPLAEPHLVEVLHLPPPPPELLDGEDVAATRMAQLQAKAVDGLALLPSAESEVRWAALEHPSRVVRAEAIDAWMWSHPGSRDLTVQPEDRVFFDRARRLPGQSAEEFDRQLQAFRDLHPELDPPVPPRRKAK